MSTSGQAKKQTLRRNWIELPIEVTASILSRLSMFDILERAQKVCRTWRRICKDPLTWRTIDMKFHRHLRQQIEGNFTLTDNVPFEFNEKIKLYLHQFFNFNVHKMCHHAIDLSCGNLVDLSIQNCGSDDLLEHMADSSRGIRRLSIVFSAYITMEGLSKVASKIPLLEDLEISYTGESNIPFGRPEHKYLEVIGRSCPLLKSLRLNKHEGITMFNDTDNGDAVAIARTMHGLQNLQLYGNKLNQQGLHAILEGCPRLESLDLRKCRHLYLGSQGWGRRAKYEACRLERFEGLEGREGPLPINSCPSHEPCSYLEDLKTRCFEQIKQLRLPEDSTDDYEHLAIHRSADRQYSEYLKHTIM